MTKTSLVRRAAEVLFCASSRCHLARLDHQSPARCQRRILLGLLHQAQATRFGREHDFSRIRTVDDFRRLVPLYTRASLGQNYWQPAAPSSRMRRGSADPADRGPLVSLLNGHTGLEEAPRLPALSGPLLAAHRDGLRTALAFLVQARPRAALLSGCLLFVGENGPLDERFPALVRPYAQTLDGELTGPLAEDAALDALAERSARLPVTCLIGSVERLLPLVERVKQLRGQGELRDVWPALTAVLYTRRSSVAPLARLQAEAGDVLFLEMVVRPEGPLAVTDPRHGCLRLLHDHGVYFEFVPPDEVHRPSPTRCGLADVEVGVPYELVLTSPAGLWACRIGRTVCLERRDPPLLRSLEWAVPTAPLIVEEKIPGRLDLPLPSFPLQAPHRQSAGSPAALPGSSSHIPWSILADRG